MVQVDGKNEFRVETKALSLKTDDDGQLQVADGRIERPDRRITNGSSPRERPRAVSLTWASRTSGHFGQQDPAV